MIDMTKSAALSLLLMLALFPSGQVAEAADGVRGRHSLIHRPQIHPAPAVRPTPSAAQPQLQSSSPSKPVQQKAVRRPAAPASPLAEVSPMAPGNSAQADSLPTPPHSYNPNNTTPPDTEMLPPPEPQESPDTDGR
jgi:hypothetical protein